MCLASHEVFQRKLAYSTCYSKNFGLRQFKSVITKTLEYKVGLKLKLKYVRVAMHSLVISHCSRDFSVTSLYIVNLQWFNLYGAWFLDSNTKCPKTSEGLRIKRIKQLEDDNSDFNERLQFKNKRIKQLEDEISDFNERLQFKEKR